MKPDTENIYQRKINQVIDYINAKDINEENSNRTLNGLEIKNNYLYSLTTINPDVVGWVKVNETNIDYAVTKSIDNEYYLTHNLYKEKDPNGWIYMDYTNNATKIDDNIILYGHNRFLNGVMFGTLNKVLYKNWYTNEKNLTITFDTLYGSYKYKIFSIYIIPTTTDYLTTNFKSNEEKLNFIKLIKDRSIYDFNVSLDENAKILTLSTCQSDTSRLVVHAYLVN